MTSATPKPRAGEHTETPETNEFAYERLRGPAQTQRYKNHNEWLTFSRKLELERDALRDKEREFMLASTEAGREIFKLTAERDALLAQNGKLVLALEHLVDAMERNWNAQDANVRLDNARAVLAHVKP